MQLFFYYIIHHSRDYGIIRSGVWYQHIIILYEGDRVFRNWIVTNTEKKKYYLRDVCFIRKENYNTVFYIIRSQKYGYGIRQQLDTSHPILYFHVYDVSLRIVVCFGFSLFFFYIDDITILFFFRFTVHNILIWTSVCLLAYLYYLSIYFYSIRTLH